MNWQWIVYTKKKWRGPFNSIAEIGTDKNLALQHPIDYDIQTMNGAQIPACTHPSLSVGGRLVEGFLDVRGLPFESRQKGMSKWLKVCSRVLHKFRYRDKSTCYKMLSTVGYPYQCVRQFMHSNGNDFIIIVYSVHSQWTKVDATSHRSAWRRPHIVPHADICVRYTCSGHIMEHNEDI